MISAILWAVVLLPLMFVFYALARFSERLGEALHLRPYYTTYYAALLLLFIGIQIKLLDSVTPDHALGCVHISETVTAIGMTIALVTTVVYWGWLLSTHH